ncbi:MAG: 23S rRNA (guanosine(2251)-2'-O)-methyltransferase RlmB [Deltaproteobacteria bacterium]|nr:23S rRNA (guanosine(2251)-2'-O)-methyltransferase RlmB [Deltaproteobacteria bacterium]
MKDTPLIPGFHAVREALAAGRIPLREVWMDDRRAGSRKEEILGLAAEKGVPVRFRRSEELEGLLPGLRHQGVVAVAGDFAYTEMEALVRDSRHRRGDALLIAADHITDEGNLGALIRTAAFFGAQGLILPRDRSARITERVLKRSAGAFVYLPVARVVNLARTLEILKREGFWIVGAAGEGPETIYRFDWRRDVVLVLGREDRGLSPVIRRSCHQLVAIPSPGSVQSLNVSVAGGIVMAEILRQRGGAQGI